MLGEHILGEFTPSHRMFGASVQDYHYPDDFLIFHMLFPLFSLFSFLFSLFSFLCFQGMQKICVVWGLENTFSANSLLPNAYSVPRVQGHHYSDDFFVGTAGGSFS